MKTVHQLRKDGNKVKVEHRRRYYDIENNRYCYLTDYEYSLLNNDLSVIGPFATGGYTHVTIKIDNLEITGIAECSKKDNYCKKIGVNLAIQRIFERDCCIKNKCGGRGGGTGCHCNSSH